MLCDKSSFLPVLFKYFHRICKSSDDAIGLLFLLVGLGWYVHLDVIHGNARVFPMDGQYVSSLFPALRFIVVEKESSWFHCFYILADS